jgi:23S rRNA G2069 N7-methylase RlmK/C1962 C5-methylase RlmI
MVPRERTLAGVAGSAVGGMSAPRLLDLFCKAGGAGMGYHRAGFDVVGVDHEPQPRYPFAFVQADALEYLAAHGHEYDAIHASPPCQGYSRLRHLPWLKGREWPLLIEPCRALLVQAGRPHELAQAIPPAYTEFIGGQMLAALTPRQAA